MMNMRIAEGRGWQYLPLAYLPWKEVEKDLLFVKPVLRAAGVTFDEKALEAMHGMAKMAAIEKENVEALIKNDRFGGALDGVYEELLKEAGMRGDRGDGGEEQRGENTWASIDGTEMSWGDGR